MLEYLQPASCEPLFHHSANSSSTSCLNKSPSLASISWPFISLSFSIYLFIWHLRALKCLRNTYHLFNRKKKIRTQQAAQNLSSTFGTVDSCLGDTRHLFLKVVDGVESVMFCLAKEDATTLSTPECQVGSPLLQSFRLQK